LIQLVLDESAIEIDRIVLPSLVQHLKIINNEDFQMQNLQITELFLKRHGDEFIQKYVELGGLERCIELYRTARTVEFMRAAAEIILLFANSPDYRGTLVQVGNQSLMKGLVKNYHPSNSK